MRVNLSVKIGKLNLKNPVILCSGTFSEELKYFLDFKKIGALVTKTITLKPNLGNPPPRTCETPSGLLNSIGLENPGLDLFLKRDLVKFLKWGVPIIVSITSIDEPEELFILAKELAKIKELKTIEVNLSCPNLRIKKLISQDKDATYNVVKKLRKISSQTLIVKLSPNVTDISEIALAAEKAGADSVSLINTVSAMAVDIQTRKPMLSTVTGGLSGPAIKPIALRAVWQVYQRVKIPIIGMGGIMDAKDAIEFILCGATAVGIGTANFVNPKASLEIIEGIKGYLEANRFKDIKELIGTLKV
ncbi:MAG: dihydroorotate dehydrogenase [Candidatus Omnitrophica bacterium]|nr:dihydroorotate dehydrogenase [Candidatus Omnitrophota bacterium]MCM8799123.1 dihydroorotate dehydrogenase [Candidatus Omnitrophota bacterium]